MMELGSRVFLLIASVFLLIGAIWLVRLSLFISTSDTASGTVIELHEKTLAELGYRVDENGNAEIDPDSEGPHREVCPVVRFQAADGRAHQFMGTDSACQDDPSLSFSIGEQVRVRYQKSDPDDAKIASFFSMWGGPMGVGLFGGCFLGAGLFLRRQARLNWAGFGNSANGTGRDPPPASF